MSYLGVSGTRNWCPIWEYQEPGIGVLSGSIRNQELVSYLECQGPGLSVGPGGFVGGVTDEIAAPL